MLWEQNKKKRKKSDCYISTMDSTKNPLKAASKILDTL